MVEEGEHVEVIGGGLFLGGEYRVVKELWVIEVGKQVGVHILGIYCLVDILLVHQVLGLVVLGLELVNDDVGHLLDARIAEAESEVL